jgi:hypothetical protein
MQVRILGGSDPNCMRYDEDGMKKEWDHGKMVMCSINKFIRANETEWKY